ncbi:MAG TPA: glycerophosphodiester phosphodiesterase [Candidatus Hydrogenedentes bacterium]|nr:glycerophosphodiester phosphodiesterase [Candidatus Hydrogenedentota bacterium]HNT86552.1 glycerophosphodiester phosphodiesterase [Candidatus Hydrogenedentota bacterium]
MRYVLITLCALLLAAPVLAEGKIVIAHRGASGYLPEHTLEAYAYAHAVGADYIEQDLALTKDGELVCLHDVTLDKTTDVAERFPDRKRDDGRWYAADFTLAEIKQLQARERLPKRFPVGKSDFEVPTFREAIELIQGINGSTGRDAGIYPELKQPSWHAAQGQDIETPFVAILREYGYDAPDARIYVQCFEVNTLKKLRHEMGLRAPQVFLMGDDPSSRWLTDEGLAEVAEFAEGIGPDKQAVEKDPDLVKRAHARGLVVHPYTARSDAVPRKYADAQAELHAFYFEYGVDGLFADFPDHAVAALRAP